jgi:hypothetical protein
MALQRVADDLWCHEGVHTMMMMTLPVRSTIIKLAGGVVVHSPIAFDDETVSEINALGPVTHLVAPNLHHSSYLPAGTSRWPEALVCMPPGLAKKRKEVKRDIRLESEPVEAWGDELDYLLFGGASLLGELLFLHRPSGTLIACDLAFNVRNSDSALFRGYLKVNGGYGRLAQTKLIKAIVRDKQAARATMERVFAWDWDRLIVGHGEIVESGAKVKLREISGWLM